MSVSFLGLKGFSVDLNNGLASRLLAAMELPSDGSGGGADLKVAAERVQAAKAKVSPDDARYLDMIEELVEDLLEAGETRLRWC